MAWLNYDCARFRAVGLVWWGSVHRTVCVSHGCCAGSCVPQLVRWHVTRLPSSLIQGKPKFIRGSLEGRRSFKKSILVFLLSSFFFSPLFNKHLFFHPLFRHARRLFLKKRRKKNHQKKRSLIFQTVPFIQTGLTIVQLITRLIITNYKSRSSF